MFRKISVLAFAAFVSSCAYTTEGSVHEMTVRTPGAHGAMCDVYVDNLRYQYFPPETRSIFRSNEDLVVDCKAPGNRRKKVVIKPKISQASNWNVANGLVPGMLWDYASETMFVYPDVVEVDFTHAEPKPSAPPAQNSPDIVQPEEYFLEEFNPGTPRMNSDRYRQPVVPKRRQPYGGFFNGGATQDSGSGLYESGGTIPPTSNDYQTVGGKGDLMSVINRTGARSATTPAPAQNNASVTEQPAPAAQAPADAAAPPSSGLESPSSAPASASGEMGSFSNDAPPMPMTITPDNFGPSDAQPVEE